MAKRDSETRRRRDLELLLFGVALARHDGERSKDGQRVLDSMPYGEFSSEINGLLEAVRRKDAKPVADWLAQRQASIENGKDAVQAAIDAITEENRKGRVQAILRRATTFTRTTDRTELIGVLKRAIEELEK